MSFEINEFNLHVFKSVHASSTSFPFFLSFFLFLSLCHLVVSSRQGILPCGRIGQSQPATRATGGGPARMPACMPARALMAVAALLAAAAAAAPLRCTLRAAPASSAPHGVEAVIARGAHVYALAPAAGAVLVYARTAAALGPPRLRLVWRHATLATRPAALAFQQNVIASTAHGADEVGYLAAEDAAAVVVVRRDMAVGALTAVRAVPTAPGPRTLLLRRHVRSTTHLP